MKDKIKGIKPLDIHSLEIDQEIEFPCGLVVVYDGIDIACKGKDCTIEQKKECVAFDPFAGLP